MAERFTVVVLAAQRGGRLDPLAAEAGVTHKCLVPIGGLPLLAHVLSAISQVGNFESIRISVEDGAADRLRPIAALLGLPVTFVAAADNIADSVYRAVVGASGPVLVTTADNVLLTPHVAGVSEWAVEVMAGRCVESILEVGRGEAPDAHLLLNPEVLGRK